MKNTTFSERPNSCFDKGSSKENKCWTNTPTEQTKYRKYKKGYHTVSTCKANQVNASSKEACGNESIKFMCQNNVVVKPA